MTPIAFRRALAVFAAFGLSAGFTPAVHAAGFYLQEQSVKGIGRAFSGEGADVGPESLWWNPAAIGGIAQSSAYLGIAGILPSGDVNDKGTLIVRPGQAPAPVGGDASAHDPIQNGALPSGAVAVPVTDRIALGLAVTAPFDFVTVYGPNSWARYTAQKTSLTTYDLQPSVAIAATDWLRLGVAANAEYSRATLSNALPNLSPLLPDGAQALRGNGWDWGWSIGAQVHNNLATIGLSYKSSIDHHLDGSVTTSGLLLDLAPENGRLSTAARFRTPWQVVVSGRFKATDRLTLDAQVVRMGWSEFNAIQLGAPINAAIPEGYRDTWSVAVGADYALCPRWTVRGGIQFDQSPTRNGDRDARVPDSDRINFALGASFQATHRLTLDAAASYVDFKDAPIDRTTAAFAGTPAQTPILVSGALQNADAVVLAFGGWFGF